MAITLGSCQPPHDHLLLLSHVGRSFSYSYLAVGFCMLLSGSARKYGTVFMNSSVSIQVVLRTMLPR